MKNKRSVFLMFSLTLALVTAIMTAGYPQEVASGWRTQWQQNEPASWTIPQWITWRDRQIAHILEPTATDQAGTRILKLKDVISRSQDAYQVVQACEQSDPNYFQDPARAHALGNFVRFVTAQHWMGITATVDGMPKNTNALGMPVTDFEYSEIAKPYVELPALLRSQEFLTKMASPATYRDAIAQIAEHNQTLPDDRKWIPLFYRAQFITTVDGTKTYGRLLVFVPNEPMADGVVADKWVLFGVVTPDMNPATVIKSVSIFTVCRSSTQTTTYFTDYMRTRDTASRFLVTSNFTLPDNPSHNCYSCHKSSVLPIHPAVEYGFDADGHLVPKTGDVGSIPAIVNSRIASYGPPHFVPLDTQAYGPCLGPEATTLFSARDDTIKVAGDRSDEFIRAATAGLDLPLSSYDAIRDAMRCSSCHERFAAINYPQAVRTDLDAAALIDTSGIVHTYIKEGIMPPGERLTDVEREALWRCLMKEYYDGAAQRGLLYDWLRSADGQTGLKLVHSLHR